MNTLEIELLSLALDNYRNTGNRYFEFYVKNSSELFNYTESAKYLADEEYIIAISDNIYSDSIGLDSFFCIIFEITDKGIEYIKNHV